MSKKKVLIVCDSRVKGLQAALDSNLKNARRPIKVTVIPGATIERLADFLAEKYDDSVGLIKVSGGICILQSYHQRKSWT